MSGSNYPPAPWYLRGTLLHSLQLVRVADARRLVPEGLKILQVLPGRTIGGVVLARYIHGSTLEYSELIVFPALVRRGSRWGAWVSHIYVDHPSSLKAGQQVWGLPKEMAEFEWEDGELGRVTVHQGKNLLCVVEARRPCCRLPFRATLPAICIRSQQIERFSTAIISRFGISSGTVEIPRASPFYTLNLDGSRRLVHHSHVSMTVHPPH